jgi:hypothetical protein
VKAHTRRAKVRLPSWVKTSDMRATLASARSEGVAAIFTEGLGERNLGQTPLSFCGATSMTEMLWLGKKPETDLNLRLTIKDSERITLASAASLHSSGPFPMRR